MTGAALEALQELCPNSAPSAMHTTLLVSSARELNSFMMAGATMSLWSLSQRTLPTLSRFKTLSSEFAKIIMQGTWKNVAVNTNTALT